MVDVTPFWRSLPKSESASVLARSGLGLDLRRWGRAFRSVDFVAPGGRDRVGGALVTVHAGL
jgi:hypothetical protein